MYLFYVTWLECMLFTHSLLGFSVSHSQHIICWELMMPVHYGFPEVLDVREYCCFSVGLSITLAWVNPCTDILILSYSICSFCCLDCYSFNRYIRYPIYHLSFHFPATAAAAARVTISRPRGNTDFLCFCLDIIGV